MVLQVLSTVPGAYGVLKVSSSVDGCERAGIWETVTLRRTNLLCEVYRLWMSLRGVTLVQWGEDACANGCLVFGVRGWACLGFRDSHGVSESVFPSWRGQVKEHSVQCWSGVHSDWMIGISCGLACVFCFCGVDVSGVFPMWSGGYWLIFPVAWR